MIDAALFKLNRQNFMSQMEDGALAVFNSNDIFPISADSTMPYWKYIIRVKNSKSAIFHL